MEVYVVKGKSAVRVVAFASVLVVVSGLVLTLFDDVRAVDMEFTTAPATARGNTDYVLELVVPEDTRVPIEAVTGIIEQQLAGATSKAGAPLVTRATCPMSGVAGTVCTPPSMVTSGSRSTGINSITFVGYFAVTTGSAVGSSSVFNTGPLDVTTTGYGYDLGTGYGYGFDTNDATNYPPGVLGTGYGYGYSADDIILRFIIEVRASALALGQTHYLTVVLDTGSSIIGDLSSPFTEFVPRGGGGGGGPPPADGGSGGTDGGQTFEVDGVEGTPPAGADSLHTAVVTAEAGDTVIINIDSDLVDSVTFEPSTDLVGATITIITWPADNPPPGVGNLPPGLTVTGFITITVSSGGTSHTVTIAITVPPGEGGPVDKAVLLKWDAAGNKWASKGKITLTQNADGSMSGTGTSDCCSVFAVAFDETDPTVTINIPAGTLTDSETVTATASDNLEVAKVEFYVDNVLKYSDTTAPYSWTFDSKSYTNGEHTIKAVAYDVVDNTAESSGTGTFSNDDAVTGTDTTTPGGDGDKDDGLPWGTILLILIVIAIIGAAGYYFFQQKKA